MIFQQVILTRGTLQQNSGKSTPLDKQTLFQNLLADTKVNTNVVTKLLGNSGQEKEALTNMLMGSKELDQLSYEDLKKVLSEALKRVSNKDSKQLTDKASTKNEALQMIEEILANLDIEKNRMVDDQKNVPMFTNIQVSTEGMDNQAIQKQFEAMLAKVETILSQVTDQKSVSKAAPALVKLLEQWTVLEKKQNTKQTSFIQDLSKGSSKEQAIWRELVQSFQKRNQLASKQQYNSDAKVTSNDVTKWLQNAMNNQAKAETASGQQSMSNISSMPMSRVEQHVIHMNLTQNAKPVDQQLIDQFQKVMKTSNFLAMQNGTSQLNITLRPENLGDMMVKLTQINGEMTVKIVVTSLAAKEMLETNMHQLRNMFSPQQVVVEKQELSSQQAQTQQKDQEEQNMGGGEQGQSNHSEQDEDQQSEEDFQTQFENILMNEKV